MQQQIWFQKYRILSLLGRGGTAEVYLAEHIKLNSLRAIKFISKNHPYYELQRNEALILKNLKHSCIPIIYDIEEDEDGSYIVEQYLEGETLKSYVLSKGPVREDIIIDFGLQLCDLIKYLHSVDKPVLYMDLKPDNIILTGMTLKLVDFGSARYLDESGDQKQIFGTKGYAAPELYHHGRLDERCDVYGLGMLLYFMATGFTVNRQSSEIDNIDLCGYGSRQLKSIINRCLKYNPSERYASVAVLSKHLSNMKHKNQLRKESNQVLHIAVAGAQPRIGTTHFSLRICSYYRTQRESCLYQEQNSSGCVRSIINAYEVIDCREGICTIEGLPMLTDGQNIQPEVNNYRVIVQDFGCLSKENIASFLAADIKLLILGAKDWELEFSEDTLDLVAEYKDVTFLFNFLNGRQYQQIIQSMGRRKSYRIPYEPDPYAAITRKSGMDFFRELLSEADY